MTREEFSAQLKHFRITSSATIVTVCTALQGTCTHMYRIERGLNNFIIEKAITYLNATGHQLIAITSNGSQHPITDNASAANLFLNARGSESAVKVAESIGISSKGLRNMETQKTQCPIDMFLKLCDYYGIEITFAPLPSK